MDTAAEAVADGGTAWERAGRIWYDARLTPTTSPRLQALVDVLVPRARPG